jgi:hypothetical protein
MFPRGISGRGGRRCRALAGYDSSPGVYRPGCFITGLATYRLTSGWLSGKAQPLTGGAGGTGRVGGRVR